ncbi:hypothetical protein BDW66DRAFT_127563 [Aspergillus desertorum]
MASTNVSSALAWSTVLASLTSDPTGWDSAKSSLIFSSSFFVPLLFPSVSSGGGSGFTFFPPEIGRTFISSSITRQESQLPSDKMKRSLNRATTSSCASVRYLEWISIDNV